MTLTRRQRNLLLATTALVAVVAFLFWLFDSPHIDTPEEGGFELPTQFAEGAIPPGPGHATSPDAGPPSRVPDGGTVARRMTEDEKEEGTGAEEPFDPEELPPTVEDPGPGEYLRHYGGRSGAMSPHARPDWANVTTQMRSFDPEPPRLLVWTPTIRVQSGQTTPVLALLRGPEGRVDAQRVTVRVWDQAGTGEAQVLPMTRAPGNDPEAPHDYELAFAADASEWPEPANGRPLELNWRVHAEGTYEGEPFARHAGGVLTIHTPGGVLQPDTAELARTSEGFVLRIDARIAKEGTYWAYAEAWAGEHGDRPVAFGRVRKENLAPGRHTFELLFGGAIIADRGIDGPYAVRNLRFMRVDTVPPQEQEPIPLVATSPPWAADSFH